MVQNTAEATGDLIRDKMPDKITSLGKTIEKEKNKADEIYIPPEKKGSK